MSRVMTEAQIEHSKTEDGDECPLCRCGTVEIVTSSRCYWVCCRGECGTVTRQHGQTDEIIRGRWGGDGYNTTLPEVGCKTAEECATYVPTWAKPIG